MKVYLHDLLGRQVHDEDGNRVGRIEAVHAEVRGEECIVMEWEIGTTALLNRLGLSAGRNPLRIPWNRLDVRNPKDVRLIGGQVEK